MKGLRKPFSEGELARQAAAKVSLNQHMRDVKLKKNREQLASFWEMQKLWRQEIWRHFRCHLCFRKSRKADRLAFYQNGSANNRQFVHNRCGEKRGWQLLSMLDFPR